MTWTWSWGSWECWTVSGQRQGNTLHGWQAHNRGFYIRSSLHVLPMLAWVSSISSWFILQSKDMQDRWTGGKTFPESVNVHQSMFPWIMCWETGIGSSIPATYKKFGKIMDVFFFLFLTSFIYPFMAPGRTFMDPQMNALALNDDVLKLIHLNVHVESLNLTSQGIMT